MADRERAGGGAQPQAHRLVLPEAVDRDREVINRAWLDEDPGLAGLDVVLGADAAGRDDRATEAHRIDQRHLSGGGLVIVDRDDAHAPPLGEDAALVVSQAAGARSRSTGSTAPPSACGAATRTVRDS